MVCVCPVSLEPSPVSFPGEFHQGIVAQAQILGDTGTNHFGYRDRSLQPVIKGSDDEPMGHGEVGDYLQSVCQGNRRHDCGKKSQGESPQDMPIVRSQTPICLIRAH